MYYSFTARYFRCGNNCKKEGYPYFALSGTSYAGRVCVCLAAKLDEDLKLELSRCNVPCLGDSSTMCGGGYFIASVYHLAMVDSGTKVFGLTYKMRKIE